MTSKEAILSKIRTGLGNGAVPMPFPEVQQSPVYPFVRKNETDDIAVLFAAEFNAIGGKFMYCANVAELVSNLEAIAQEKAWSQVFCQEPSLLKHFNAAQLPFVKTGTYDTTLDAAVTFCKYAIARTGGLVITSDTVSGRALPIYCPVHICVVYSKQVVFDIGDALLAAEQEYGTQLPSMINIATGPSRTADIEKTLVVGVHGPKEVYVLFLDEKV
jgi:L-lactate dehydrogenase complex protein LldG